MTRSPTSVAFLPVCLFALLRYASAFVCVCAFFYGLTTPARALPGEAASRRVQVSKRGARRCIYSCVFLTQSETKKENKTEHNAVNPEKIAERVYASRLPHEFVAIQSAIAVVTGCFTRALIFRGNNLRADEIFGVIRRHHAGFALLTLEAFLKCIS